MKNIYKAILTISQLWSVPVDKMVITYSPTTVNNHNNLFVWGIVSGSTSSEYNSKEFTLEALEFDKEGGWYIRSQYEDMGWACYSINDKFIDQDLGPHQFAKTYKDFAEYVEKVSTKIPEDTHSILLSKNIVVKEISEKVHEEVKLNHNQYLSDPNYPISYKIKGNEFKSLKDVERYILFDKLRLTLFDGFVVKDNVKLEFVKRLIRNKDEISKLLKGL